MRQLFFTFLIFSILIHSLSCTRKRENELESYLKSINTPFAEHKMYVLIPAEQCGGCFYYDAMGLSNEVNKNTVIINTQPKAQILNFKKVVLDKENLLYSLTSLNHTNKIAFCKNHELFYVSIYDITKQLDSIYKAIKYPEK